FLVFAFANAMYTALTGVYPGEVFPTEIRGLGTGFATAVSRIGAGIGTFLLPWSMHNLGGATTMLMAAGVCVVGALVSQVLAPETMGRNLSETSAPHGSPAPEAVWPMGPGGRCAAVGASSPTSRFRVAKLRPR